MVGSFEFTNDEYEARERNMSIVCDNSRPCSWLRRVPRGQEPLSPDSSFGDQYITSFFWSLTTLMKTPWIGPDTIAEKITTIVAICSGAVFYASFLGTVQGGYASYNKASVQKRDKITTLTGFMKHYSIPQDLQQKLIYHTNTQAATLPLGLNNTSVLMQLPSHLRGDVALELYAEACGSPSAMFRDVSIECAKAMVMRLQTQMAMTNQVVIAKDEVCKQLYFLVRGALRVTVEAPSDDGGASASPSARSPNCTGEAGASRVSRNSSRKSISGMRELERPGGSVGLVEPKDGAGLGLYPVWVTATKKTLLLYISQGSMAEVVSAFVSDLVPLRESLAKQHRSLLDSLKVTSGPDSPIGAMESMLLRKKEKEEAADELAKELAVVTEEDQARVKSIEEGVGDLMNNVAEIKKNMEVLPRILALVEKMAEQDAAEPNAGPA